MPRGLRCPQPPTDNGYCFGDSLSQKDQQRRLEVGGLDEEGRDRGGEIFPARTRCSGTVSPGSCLGPVEEEGGCVFVCVGGGEVYVDREIRWHSGKACEKTEHLSAR